MPGELPIPPIPVAEAFSVLTYLPQRSTIASITKAVEAEIVTNSNHNLIDNEIVRFYIPLEYGMQQIDLLTGEVLVINATTFCVDIDSTQFDSFVVPGAPNQEAQVVPIGENNTILQAATRNIL